MQALTNTKALRLIPLSGSDESWTHIAVLSTVGFNTEPTISWQTHSALLQEPVHTGYRWPVRYDHFRACWSLTIKIARVPN